MKYLNFASENIEKKEVFTISNKNMSSQTVSENVEKTHKQAIIAVLLYSLNKPPLEETETDEFLRSKEIIFPNPEPEKGNILKTRLFVSAIRANSSLKSDDAVSNLLEILLFPMQDKVFVNEEVLNVLEDKSIMRLWEDIFLTSSCRTALQKYITVVEEESKSELINTNIVHSLFVQSYLSKSSATNKHIIVVYLLSFIIECVQLGPLNRNKTKIVKSILRVLNRSFNSVITTKD
jgi:hypothetical protein